MVMLRAYMRRLPMLRAQEQLRQVAVVSFPHIGGDSKNPKQAAAQANKKRRKLIQEWTRTARGLSRHDVIEGIDRLESAQDVRNWLGMRGIAVS